MLVSFAYFSSALVVVVVVVVVAGWLWLWYENVKTTDERGETRYNT